MNDSFSTILWGFNLHFRESVRCHIYTEEGTGTTVEWRFIVFARQNSRLLVSSYSLAASDTAWLHATWPQVYQYCKFINFSLECY